jgi:hypothetical protein
MAADPDDDKGVMGKAIPVVHAGLFVICSQPSRLRRVVSLTSQKILLNDGPQLSLSGKRMKTTIVKRLNAFSSAQPPPLALFPTFSRATK